MGAAWGGVRVTVSSTSFVVLSLMLVVESAGNARAQ
jgi:hypothetical protein